MGTSIAVQEDTRNRLEQLKRRLGESSLDGTILRLLAHHDQSNGLMESARLLQAAVRKRQAVADFAKQNGIVSVKLFGSAIHGDARAESDLDVLVELRKDSKIGLLGFAALERKLSEVLGVKVDLQTPASISKYFRDEVLAEALPLYG